MKWTTQIADAKNEDTNIRGHSLAKLVGTATYADMVFLLLQGKLPSVKERKLLDAMFVSAIEHGVGAPSATTARIVSSAGGGVSAAVAAGVLAIGDNHGGAGEQAAKLFTERMDDDPAEIVREYRAAKKKLPGFGHRVYTRDPRVEPLYALAQELGLAGKHVACSKAIEHALVAETGKPLHLNIDGALAALACDLGFSPDTSRALFIISRTPSLCAHAIEEQAIGGPYKREDEQDITYTGPKDK